jgi:hypothetical protein
MEPVSGIVTVLALVGGAMLKTVVSEPTKDAYARLKRYIAEKYNGPAIESLEENPFSQARQLVVQEVLDETGLSHDPTASELAAALMELVIERDRQALEVVGVDIGKAKAVNIRLKDIVSTGSGVRIKDTEASGDIEITGVTAGIERETHRKNE